MPMIINGGSRCASGFWARHLQNAEKNERVSVIEIRGLAAENVADAFTELDAIALGASAKNHFYVADINPVEALTAEQWTRAVDALEENLGLSGQARFVVEHEKEGRTHRHVVWSRLDEDLRVISDSHTAFTHERTSRLLEREFGLELGRSVLVKDRDFERERNVPKWEYFRGLDSGVEPRDLKAEIRALRESCDNGAAFLAAMQERGFPLCQGDRRDFLFLDHAGEEHSLGRYAGMKAAAFREFMSDVDRSQLPTLAEAQAQYAREHERGEERERAGDTDSHGAYVEKRRNELAGVETVKQIGIAWAESHDGASLAAALDERGLILLRATKGDVQLAQANRTWLQAGRVLEVGEFLVMNDRGHVYRLDETTIYDNQERIEARLAEVAVDQTLSMAQANDLANYWRLEAAQVEEFARPLAVTVGRELRNAGDTMFDAGASALHAGGQVLGFGVGIARAVIAVGEGIMDFFLGGEPSPRLQAPRTTMADQSKPPPTRGYEPQMANNANVQQQARINPSEVSQELAEALRRVREQQERERGRSRS